MGVSLALPLLEAMTPARSLAATAAGPTRAAFVYVPNGADMPAWCQGALKTSHGWALENQPL